MTRLILITLALSLTACGPRHSTNLAIAAVHAVEQDAHCEGGYEGEGDKLTYSTVCRFPGAAVHVECRLSTAMPLRCEPLGGPPHPGPTVAAPEQHNTPPRPTAPPLSPDAVSPPPPYPKTGQPPPPATP